MDCVACPARCPGHAGPSSAPSPPRVPQTGTPLPPSLPAFSGRSPRQREHPFPPLWDLGAPPGPRSAPGPARSPAEGRGLWRPGWRRCAGQCPAGRPARSPAAGSPRGGTPGERDAPSRCSDQVSAPGALAMDFRWTGASPVGKGPREATQQAGGVAEASRPLMTHILLGMPPKGGRRHSTPPRSPLVPSKPLRLPEVGRAGSYGDGACQEPGGSAAMGQRKRLRNSAQPQKEGRPGIPTLRGLCQVK